MDTKAIDARMAKFWFGLRRRADFYADMAAFLDAGKAPTEIIADMLKVASRRKRLRHMAFILRDLHKGLESGQQSLGLPLLRWVPSIEATMVTTGEQSGTLADAFLELAWTVGEQARIRETAVKRIAPLGFVLLMALGLMIYTTMMVVPQAAAMISPEQLEALIVAPFYVAFGIFFIENLLFIGLGVLALVVAALASVPRWTGSWRGRADGIAVPWGIYRWTQAAFFLSSVSGMLKSGSIMRDVLAEIRRNGTPWQRWHLRRMLLSLDSGDPAVEALDTGMLPEQVMDRLLMYSTLPDFSDVMRRLAKDSMKMYEGILDKLSATVQAAILLFLAVFILVTVGSMMEIALAVADAAEAGDADALL